MALVVEVGSAETAGGSAFENSLVTVAKLLTLAKDKHPKELCRKLSG
jgi:hypothetical protein